LAADYPTSIRLPPDLKRTIAKAAKKQGCSLSFKISEVLRLWEQAWLQQEKQP
jgi:predicted HicB family RNase H-like nuclease